LGVLLTKPFTAALYVTACPLRGNTPAKFVRRFHCRLNRFCQYSLSGGFKESR
jgi:hypothetical protein